MTERQEQGRFKIMRVSEPQHIISADQAQILAPEFNYPRDIDLIYIRQAEAKFTDTNETLLTRGITHCHLAILRTQINEGNTHLNRYGFVHVLSGELSMHQAGHRLEDISDYIGEHTVAIYITGSNSAPPQTTWHELKSIGVLTIKHIDIDTIRWVAGRTGNMWLHVAYRPESDTILARVGSDYDISTPVYVFSGFNDILVPPEAFNEPAAQKTHFLQKRGREELLFIVSEMLAAIENANDLKTLELFIEAKNCISKYNLQPEKITPLWIKLKKRFEPRPEDTK